jgi:hypothetical protein
MARTIKVRIRKGRVVDPTELPEDIEGWLTISDEGREEGSPVDQIEVLAETLDDRELARRAALLNRILEGRKQRVIAPVTAAELIREVRDEEGAAHGQEAD